MTTSRPMPFPAAMAKPVAAAIGINALTHYQRAYLSAFILANLMCWAPSKLLAYFAPIATLLWFILFAKAGVVAKHALTGVVASVAAIAAYAIFNEEFIVKSAFVSLFTYSSAFFLLAIPNRPLASWALVTRMVTIIRIVVLIEATYGIFQAVYGFIETGTFDSANGDRAQGTIYPYLKIDGAFANPMYGANMVFLWLSLLPFLLRFKGTKLPFLLASLAIVLASVLHQVLFLLVALVAAILIINPRILASRNLALAAIPLILLPLLAYTFLPHNVKTFEIIYGEFQSGESPRSHVLSRVFTDMPVEYPMMPVFGLGPGQFSSRAALISTGYYFGGPLAAVSVLPFSPVVPPALSKYLLDLWIRVTGNAFYGSSQKPFFSWLSAYVEFGAIGVLLVATIVGVCLWRLGKGRREGNDRWLPIATASSIIFLTLLGLQENYWEVPQAIFTGVVMMKVYYAISVYPTRLGGRQ